MLLAEADILFYADDVKLLQMSVTRVLEKSTIRLMNESTSRFGPLVVLFSFVTESLSPLVRFIFIACLSEPV